MQLKLRINKYPPSTSMMWGSISSPAVTLQLYLTNNGKVFLTRVGGGSTDQSVVIPLAGYVDVDVWLREGAAGVAQAWLQVNNERVTMDFPVPVKAVDAAVPPVVLKLGAAGTAAHRGTLIFFDDVALTFQR